MPRIFDLEEYSTRLKNVNLIVGEGLCSNIYVVGSEEAVVIDTGVGNYSNPVWPQLEELGMTPDKVKGVVLTHAHHDHAMGAFIILQRADPKVFVHRLDTQYIASRFGPNLVKVEDGNIIETQLWPLRVVWTPGHTEGGMCLYARDERILFSGDTVFPDGNYGSYYSESGSLHAIIESLHKLSKLEVDIMLPGHGRPILEEASEHIKLAYTKASRHVVSP